MEKFSVFFVKWVVVPVAIGAAGFMFIGPKLGGANRPESAPDEKATPKSDVGGDGSEASVAPTSDEPKAAKAEKPTNTTPNKADSEPDATSDTAPAKFDSDVPNNAGDTKPATGVTNSPDSIAVESASSKHQNSADGSEAAIVKVRPRPKPKPKPKADQTGADGSTIVHKRSGGADDGPGDDIKHIKQPKPKKEADKGDGGGGNLPTTPPDTSGGDGG